MAKYLIKLKPIEKYYFGDDNGFNTSKLKNKGSRSYILSSRDMPQQSSILGMLRFEILKQSRNFIVKSYSTYNEDDFNKMHMLIGDKSFKIDNNNFEFGKIQKIGNIKIYDNKNKEFLYNVPLDHLLKSENDEYNMKYIPFTLSDEQVETSFGKINYFMNYNAKNGLSNDYLNVNNVIVKKDDIFQESAQVGVNTEKMRDFENNKDEENNAFYKQIFKTFRNEFCFAFYLELKDFELENSIVELGKERSTFKMEVINLCSEEENYNKFDNKVYCESDVYLTGNQMKKINEIIKFKINNSISFRNLRRIKGSYKFVENKYDFIKRGSIFFVESKNKVEVIKIIEENKKLTNVGYNTVY